MQYSTWIPYGLYFCIYFIWKYDIYDVATVGFTCILQGSVTHIGTYNYPSTYEATQKM